MLPVFVLYVLAPLISEYLSGDIALDGILALLGFLALNGGWAVLVREIVLRRGGGWPGLVLLAAAIGVIEEGLLDQSLFNPHFSGNPHWLVYGYLPDLGTSPVVIVFLVGMDAVWSVLVPIALTESMFPSRAGRPWLGRVGLGVAAGLFLVGAVATWAVNYRLADFTASPKQLGYTALVALVLIVLGARRGPLEPGPLPGQERGAPSPLVVGGVAFLASSGFQVVKLLTEPAVMPAWTAVAGMLLIIVGALLLFTTWSGRAGWTAAHRFALAAGALLTYCWFGPMLMMSKGDPTQLAEQIVLVAVTVIATITLARRVGTAGWAGLVGQGKQRIPGAGERP